VRSLIRQLALVSLCLAGPVAVNAQFANRVYYSPGSPLSPTDPKTCSDLANDWATAIATIEKDHQACLDTHTHDPNLPTPNEKDCSRSACQSLHNIMFRFRAESQPAIDQCNKQVEEYQKAQAARKEEEERRKQEAADQQRAADEQRRKALEEADRQREAARRAAEDAARREKERQDRQKAFDEETKRRTHEQEQLAKAKNDADSRLSDAQQKKTDAAKTAADRQMDAIKNDAAPPGSDADKIASGFDFSGAADRTDSDDHLFNIDASSAYRILNEVGERVHEAGKYVVDKAIDAAKDKLSDLFTRGDYKPYEEAVKSIVSDALKTSENDDVDRGAWLRSTLADKAATAATDWLHDKTVEAGAAPGSDPLEHQVNRAFSAAQIWNIGFGFKSYLTKISDEGLKAISL